MSASSEQKTTTFFATFFPSVSSHPRAPPADLNEQCSLVQRLHSICCKCRNSFARTKYGRFFCGASRLAWAMMKVISHNCANGNGKKWHRHQFKWNVLCFQMKRTIAAIVETNHVSIRSVNRETSPALQPFAHFRRFLFVCTAHFRSRSVQYYNWWCS